MSAINSVAAARELMASAPESFSLPMGLIDTASHDQLMTLAAIFLIWVARREQVSPEVALRRLSNDYVMSSILREAAARQVEERS